MKINLTTTKTNTRIKDGDILIIGNADLSIKRNVLYKEDHYSGGIALVDLENDYFIIGNALEILLLKINLDIIEVIKSEEVELNRTSIKSNTVDKKIKINEKVNRGKNSDNILGILESYQKGTTEVCCDEGYEETDLLHEYYDNGLHCSIDIIYDEGKLNIRMYAIDNGEVIGTHDVSLSELYLMDDDMLSEMMEDFTNNQ